MQAAGEAPEAVSDKERGLFTELITEGM